MRHCHRINKSVLWRNKNMLYVPDGCVVNDKARRNYGYEGRGEFRTHLNIYDEAFLRKYRTAKNRSLFLQKMPIVDLLVGSKYVSGRVNRNIENIGGRWRSRGCYGKRLFQNIAKSEIPWVAPFSESNIHNPHST